MIIKKHETCGIKYKDCQCYIEYKKVKDDIIVYKYKCFCCKKNYQKSLMKTWRSNLLIHPHFLAMILWNLFCC